MTGSHLPGHSTHWSNTQGEVTTGEVPIIAFTETMARLTACKQFFLYMHSSSVVSHCAADKDQFQRQVKTRDKVAIVTHLQHHIGDKWKKKVTVDGCFAAYKSLLGCKRHV